MDAARACGAPVSWVSSPAVHVLPPRVCGAGLELAEAVRDLDVERLGRSCRPDWLSSADGAVVGWEE